LWYPEAKQRPKRERKKHLIGLTANKLWVRAKGGWNYKCVTPTRVVSLCSGVAGRVWGRDCWSSDLGGWLGKEQSKVKML
jgi:hypothetical protein